jgi:hypothetical protein
MDMDVFCGMVIEAYGTTVLGYPSEGASTEEPDLMYSITWWKTLRAGASSVAWPKPFTGLHRGG